MDDVDDEYMYVYEYEYVEMGQITVSESDTVILDVLVSSNSF